MDQRQRTESRHAAGTTAQHTRYRYGALRSHDDAGKGGRAPWSAARSGWPAHRLIRRAGAVRLEVDAQESGMLTENNQRSPRRFSFPGILCRGFGLCSLFAAASGA